MVEPLSALLITRLQLVVNSLSANFSFLVRLCWVVDICFILLISSLAASKASSSTLGPITGVMVFISSCVGFLYSTGSSFTLGALGGLIIPLSFLFAF